MAPCPSLQLVSPESGGEDSFSWREFGRVEYASGLIQCGEGTRSRVHTRRGCTGSEHWLQTPAGSVPYTCGQHDRGPLGRGRERQAQVYSWVLHMKAAETWGPGSELSPGPHAKMSGGGAGEAVSVPITSSRGAPWACRGRVSYVSVRLGRVLNQAVLQGQRGKDTTARSFCEHVPIFPRKCKLFHLFRPL